MQIIPVERPDWPDFFLGLALCYARRSIDANTKVGCIITDTRNRILGAGYNAHPEGCDSSRLPNARPRDGDGIWSKYDWMQHSEVSAINNCQVKRAENSIAYLTHLPCLKCLSQHLYPFGVRRVVYIEGTIVPSYHDRELPLIKIFLNHTKDIELIAYKPNLEWIQDVGP